MKKAVFISSTFEDLKNHRLKIWDLLEQFDVDVRGMERFGARKEAPLITCLSEVEQCDIFVGILALRLGSIDEVSGKSFSQREYERAYELKHEILIYMIDEKDSLVSLQNIDFGEKREKLIAFKSILRGRHTVDFFLSGDDLVEKLKRKFDELLTSKKLSPDTSADEYENSKKIIGKFLLLPKVYTGQVIKLKVDFLGNAFPASKSLCSNFNLEYGKTIGVKVKIKAPLLEDDVIEYVFVDEGNLDDFFSLQHLNDQEVYGKLQFSVNRIEELEANFVKKEYYVGGAIFMSTSLPSGLMNEPMRSLGERRVVEAEGRVIIKLTEFIDR
ncbi:MAG: DUF4062 domain-containing protein [Desulfobulbaceae bacterium]|nr:DUF4062 domain-containing protein [Desulfobulbaceae bacterium]